MQKLWPAWAGLAALLIILPGLGSAGFWEPQEIAVADGAKKRLERYSLAEITSAVAAEFKVRAADLPAPPGPGKDLGEAQRLCAELAHRHTIEPDFEIVQACGPAESSATDYHSMDAIVARLDDVRAKRLAGEKQTRPDFTERAVAAGMARRQDELGARLPLALLGLLALIATYYLGLRLGGPRTGLMGSLILLTMPLFLLQSRQLTSDIGGITGSTLLMAGLAGLCWPAEGRAQHRPWLYAVDVVLLGLGAYLSFEAAGVLLGQVPVAGAVAVACLVALAVDRGPAAFPPPLAPVNGPPQGERDWRLIHLLVGAAVGLLLTGGLLAWVLTSTFDLDTGDFKPRTDYVETIGGLWKSQGDLNKNFDSLFDQIAFGGFPWVALAPVALAHLAMGGRRGRRAWAGYLMFGWAGLAWVVGAVMQRKVGAVHYPAMAALAVGVALWLDDLLDARAAAAADDGPPEGLVDRIRARFGMAPALPLAALFGFGAAIVLAKDLRSFSEELTSLHVIGPAVAYPKGLMTREALPFLGLLFAIPLGLGLWLNVPRRPTPDRPWTIFPAVPLLLAFSYCLLAAFTVGMIIRDKPTKPTLVVAGLALVGALLSLLLTRARERRELFTALAWRLGRAGVPWAMGVSLFCAFWLAHCWTPALSQKLSSKDLFAAYHRYRANGDRLGVMGTSGSGPKYYAGGSFTRLDNRGDLVGFLSDQRHSFALMPAGELCPLHKAAKGKFDYAVLDDSNAQFLLVANYHPDDAEDQNPLARSILRAAPPGMGDKVIASFEDKIELIGVDLPRSASRGSSFEMVLYFRVLKAVGANWKIFVHFDGGGLRFQGDHDPIQGRCGTNYWQEGDIIVDRFSVDAGDMSYEKTGYAAKIGFFQGSHGSWKNMKVTRGPKDDNDRVTVGTIIID